MKMKQAEFLTLSAFTMMLTALGIDIMLPAFGEVRKHFGLPSSSNATAQIVSFFFLGQIAQLIYGVLSDKLGRIAILRIGFPLYIIGGIAATFAPSLPLMLAARFVAGMGASAVLMTTVAGVRDRYVGSEMARTMSLIFAIFLSTPVFAPFLGIAILKFFSWRVVFMTPVVFAAIVFLWSTLRLEESLPKEKRVDLNWNTFVRSLKDILTNGTFLRNATISTMLFAALSAWVGSSEHIVDEIYKKPQWFAWTFAGIGAWMAVCTLTNSKLTMRFGARQTVRTLLFVYSGVALVFLICALVLGDPPPLFLFFMFIALLLGLNIAIEPNASALALEPMGEKAGMAASVYGTYFFVVGSILGAVISGFMQFHVLPIVISFFGFGVLSLMLTKRG
jgi:MFS transporter, DHA1 family, multidrug resistance protein